MSASSLECEVKSQKNWFLLLFLRGYHFPPGMFWSMLSLGLLTAFLCLLQFHWKVFEIRLPLTLHSLLGFVVSLLLVFRTNSAYERWWEGRRLLGQLNDSSRYLALKLRAFLQADASERLELARLLCAYVWGVKEHLRKTPREASARALGAERSAAYQGASHGPLHLLGLLAEKVAALHRERRLDEGQLIVTENGLKVLGDVLGSCERIQSTPIPLAYTLHLRRIIFLYVASLPVGLLFDYHWFAIPVVMGVFYIMAGIEFIGEEIEDPFGPDENDLPMTRLSARISAGVCEILGVEDPGLPTPVLEPLPS